MKKFILAPYVRVGFLDDTLHFGFGSVGQKITKKNLQICMLDAAVLMKTPHGIEELSACLRKNGHDSEVVEVSVDTLLRNFLIPENAYNREERHSRSFLFYSLSGADLHLVQKNVSNKTVAIVGCGGVGNVISSLLATAGVEKFILVDSDRIELSNLSRQIMFREFDCGKYKTSILAQALRDRFSEVKISEFRELIGNNNIEYLLDADFIVVSGDQENLVDVINCFAIKHNIPFMNVGYIEDIAVWGPLVIPSKTGCYRCKQHLVNFNNVSQDQIEKCGIINRSYQAPSTGPINMIASSCAALDILKFFGNFGEIQSLNTRIGIWSHDLHIEKQDYSLNPSCEVCSRPQRIS